MDGKGHSDDVPDENEEFYSFPSLLSSDFMLLWSERYFVYEIYPLKSTET
jgi:hypothetical protein